MVEIVLLIAVFSECWLFFLLQLFLLLLQQRKKPQPTTSTCPQVVLQQW
jgi:hypothetical protein